MEEARDSSKTQSEDIGPRKQLLYDFFFRKYGINSYDPVDEKNLPFLQTISSDSLLYNTYCKSRDSVEGDLTLDIFLDDLITTIKVLHKQIAEESSKINKMKENSRVIETLVKKLEERKTEAPCQEFPTILISYVKDKSCESDIFKICRLKYKVSTNIDPNHMYSVYSEKKNKVCAIDVKNDIDCIYVHILAKKIDNYIEEEKDFRRIATASLAITPLCSEIKPLFLDLDDIPPIYQTINYVYDPFEHQIGEGVNEISCNFKIKFEIKAKNKAKINMMKNLLAYYPERIEEDENLMNKRILLVQELLMPFDGYVIYDRNSDVFLKKCPERSCSIDFCTLI